MLREPVWSLRRVCSLVPFRRQRRLFSIGHARPSLPDNTSYRSRADRQDSGRGGGPLRPSGAACGHNVSASAHIKIVRFDPGVRKGARGPRNGTLPRSRGDRQGFTSSARRHFGGVPAGLAYCPRGVAEDRSVQPASSDMETVGGACTQRWSGGVASSCSSSAWATAAPSSCSFTWCATAIATAFEYEVAYMLEDFDALVPQLTDAGVPVHSLGGGPRTAISAGHSGCAACCGRVTSMSCTRICPTRQRSGAWLLPSARRRDVGRHSSTPSTACGTRCQSPSRCSTGRPSGWTTASSMVSQAAKESLPPSLRRRATVVIHGIEMEPVQQARARREITRREVRQEFGLADGELLALTVANLRREKGSRRLAPSRGDRRRTRRARPLRRRGPGAAP